MSRCTKMSQEFISEITRAIKQSNGIYEARVYYDASPRWAKRDYCADITISRSRGWSSYDTQYLKERMREAGATDIIGGIKHAICRDYLDLAFDIKKSKMKELGIGIDEKLKNSNIY